MAKTPKDQVKERLEQIKEEQNRKFSLLYEHYKTNVEAVLQQQNLKLNSTQQMEQDQLNEDLDKQMKLLYQSHANRKQQQSDTFFREGEQLEAERKQRFKDLDLRIQDECEDLEKNCQKRLEKLKDGHIEQLDKFDKECYDKYNISIGLNQINNRLSRFNLGVSSNNSPISIISYSSGVTNGQENW